MNHHFNDLCTPYLYRELNLHRPHISIKPTYIHHVRTIRIAVDHVAQSTERIQGVLDMIDCCPNIISLGLYHDSQGAYTSRSFLVFLAREIVARLGVGKFHAVGFYAGWASFEIINLLHEVLSHPQSLMSIHKLDISINASSQPTFLGPLSALCSLQSLTILNWQGVDLRWRGSGKMNFWASAHTLTHLRLIQCKDPFLPEIPNLVRRLVALNHLVITTLGRQNSRTPIVRDRGWSNKPDSVSSAHSPLSVLHLEDMDVWETLALGTIPVHSLTLIYWPSDFPFGAFLLDTEVFPYLEVLHLGCTSMEEDPNFQESTVEKLQLQAFCHDRDVALQFDGQSMIPHRLS